MSPRHLLTFLLPAVVLAVAATARADTLYKCVDTEGHATYTNQKSAGKSCTVLSQDKPVSTFTPPRRASPSEFPKVSGEAQKSRDDDRRKILEGELATEKKSLEEAKKALAEQEAVREGGERNYQRVLDRLKPYQDSVALHQRNIAALEKELSNLK